jgi:hypothetical protein
MRITRANVAILLLAATSGLATNLDATPPDPADESIRQFLAHDDTLRPYRAVRRLEAENGKRAGWLEAVTEYSVAGGFHYQVTAEGGSESIRSRVLRAVLDGEGDAFARGEMGRSSLVRANYAFQPNGLDAAGLANVILVPRRKERILVMGKMFLEPDDGRLVRLQGQLASSPSFWVKDVEIVRLYERIAGTVVPVALESKAHVRFLGPATLRMTYAYSEIDGHSVGAR